MRFGTIVLSLSLAAAGPLAIAQPHRHAHRHAIDKREAEVVNVPGPTVITYVLDGKTISEEEVKKGLADGYLRLVDGGGIAEQPSPSEDAPVVEPTPDIQKQDEEEPAKEEASSDEKPSSDQAPPPTEQEAPPSDYSASQGGDGVERDFPDGEVDCSHFPSDYGAVAIDWENLGGWIGLQKVTYNGDGSAVTDIVTMKTGPCDEGMMCSYACPAGYLKAQWPAAQGSTGQSVGGIECKNGKLHLPRAATSKKLCVPGAGGVHVENKVGKAVAVCRTDYPGS